MRRLHFALAARLVLGVSAGAMIASLDDSRALASGRCGIHPWCDTSLSPDERAGLLLDALTPDERVSLLAGDDLFGVSGQAHTHTGTSDGVPRVDLPTIYYSDGPMGSRQGQATAMPAPLGLAATWDAGMAERYGAVVANEVKNKGNDVVFAPTVNIMRTPLGGRTFEGYGEDPFLVSRIAVGWIRGAQGEGVIADAKHFAANNQEGLGPEPPPGAPIGLGLVGDRFTVNAVVDERTLREIYLPAFEAAVKEAQVGSVMCAYNRLNGQYACENQHLLESILEDDWGFPGYVLSDYGAAHPSGTAASLTNGLDFEPWPGWAYSPLEVEAALAAGLASPADVDEHVRRILRTLFAFGAFDRAAYVDDDAQIDKQGHADAAGEVEEAAITLLENSGALPLDASTLTSVAIIGSDADRFQSRGGSAGIRPFFFDTPREKITERVGPGVEVRYDPGDDHGAAAAMAAGADVALVFVSDTSIEGVDRPCLSLNCPGDSRDQDGLITAVAASNPNTVVVLETGAPVLTPWRDQVRAIVEAWVPGVEAGTAITRVLFGDVDPGGRLPATFPRQEGDIPTAGDPEKYPGVAETVQYKEGVFVGYRWYDAMGIEPAFPFGLGLSYTSFAYRNLKISSTPGGGAVVQFNVKNTGTRRGTDVAQLYLGLPSLPPAAPQPPRALKGFARVDLAPGESTRVQIVLDARAFSYWNAAADGWAVAPGCYRVMVGRSSRDIRLEGVVAQGGALCAAPLAG